MIKLPKFIFTILTLASMFSVTKNEVLAEEISTDITFELNKDINEDNSSLRTSLTLTNSPEVEEQNSIIDIDNEKTHELKISLDIDSPVEIKEEEEGIFSIYDSNGKYSDTIAVSGEQNTEEQLPIKDVTIKDKEIAVEFDTSSVTGEVQLFAAKASKSYSYYFSSGKWITRDGKLSLSLQPKSEWVRIARTNSNPNASNAVRVDSWRKVLDRHSSHSNWKNTSSMKKQYDCHINWAGMTKVPWNIEPWRTGNANATNLCNP